MITILTFKDTRPVPARMLFPDKMVRIETRGTGKNEDLTAFSTKDKKVHDTKIKEAIAAHTLQYCKNWWDPATGALIHSFPRKVYRVDTQ